jgi:hypothetical protein
VLTDKAARSGNRWMRRRDGATDHGMAVWGQCGRGSPLQLAGRARRRGRRGESTVAVAAPS